MGEILIEIFDDASGLFDYLQEHPSHEWMLVEEGNFIVHWKKPHGKKEIKPFPMKLEKIVLQEGEKNLRKLEKGLQNME